MTYIDGVMLAVPTKNKAAYLDHARTAAAAFKKYGALNVVENWGETVPEGKKNSMNTAVLREDGETVVLSWITWPSKDVRDAAWPKLLQDPLLTGAKQPFDGSRMIFGGFDQILSV